jgi:hypothetical protein
VLDRKPHYVLGKKIKVQAMLLRHELKSSKGSANRVRESVPSFSSNSRSFQRISGSSLSNKKPLRIQKTPTMNSMKQFRGGGSFKQGEVSNSNSNFAQERTYDSYAHTTREFNFQSSNGSMTHISDPTIPFNDMYSEGAPS